MNWCCFFSIYKSNTSSKWRLSKELDKKKRGIIEQELKGGIFVRYDFSEMQNSVFSSKCFEVFFYCIFLAMPNMLSKLSAQARSSSWLTSTLSKVSVQLTLLSTRTRQQLNMRALSFVSIMSQKWEL